jgi:hypothetical protein
MTTQGKSSITSKSGLKTRVTKTSKRYFCLDVIKLERSCGLIRKTDQVLDRESKPYWNTGKGLFLIEYTCGLLLVGSRNSEITTQLWFAIDGLPIHLIADQINDAHLSNQETWEKEVKQALVDLEHHASWSRYFVDQAKHLFDVREALIVAKQATKQSVTPLTSVYIPEIKESDFVSMFWAMIRPINRLNWITDIRRFMLIARIVTVFDDLLNIATVDRVQSQNNMIDDLLGDYLPSAIIDRCIDLIN